MGALLVTLLQCRNIESLYPNISATQARQVTYQRPCSIPLITPHAPQRRSTSSSASSSSLTEVGAAHADGINTTNNNEGAHHHHERVHVSSNSSELEAGPGFYAQRQRIPEALKSFTDKNGAIQHTEDVNTDGQNSDDKENAMHNNAARENREKEEALAAKRQASELYRHEQLRLGLTRPRHTSVHSGERKHTKRKSHHSHNNAIYRYTLPGALTPATATSGTTKTALRTPPPPPLSSREEQRTQPQHQHHLGVETEATPPVLSGCRGGGRSDSTNSTNQRHHHVTRPAALAGADGMHGASAAAAVFDANFHGKHNRRQTLEGGHAYTENGPSVIATMEEDEDLELGPMDCADAFQYFYDDEETYGDVESVAYVAPTKAQLATPKGMARDFYLNQRTALGAGRVKLPLGDVESLGTGTLEISQNARRDSQRSSAALPLLDAMSNDRHTRSFLAAVPTTSSTTAADSAKPPNDAGRFVSLVEEMYMACRRLGNAAIVCWRSVDRITSFHESSRGLFGMGGSNNGGANSALQNARGEVEDDVSHLPGAVGTAMKDTPPRRLTAAHFFRSCHHHSSTRDEVVEEKTKTPTKTTRGEASRASSLYYLGPQQYLTASVWWSRVEAFSFGLRSIGLRPGSFFGIVEDTRWEWLVTCYAAWNTGLVVVVFDSSEQTMRRVVMDTFGEMKAVVCNPQVHRRLRQHFKAAAAQHSEAQATSTSDNSKNVMRCASENVSERTSTDRNAEKCIETGLLEHSNSNNNNTAVAATLEDTCLSDSTGRSLNVGVVTTTSASTNIAVHVRPDQKHQQRPQQPRKQEEHVAPLFIVVRTAIPARDGEGEKDTREAQIQSNKKSRGNSAGRTDAGGFSSSSRGGRRGHYMDGAQQDTEKIPTHVHEDDPYEDGNEEDEEEEALWWSDVLSYGEAKLAAWRQRKARERRHSQQKQVRLRFQQQQRQRWARNDASGISFNDGIDVNGTATAALRRRQKSSASANSAVGSGGSREGSAVSTSIAVPTLGWAAATTCTTTTTAAASFPSPDFVSGGPGGGQSSTYASPPASEGMDMRRSATVVTPTLSARTSSPPRAGNTASNTICYATSQHTSPNSPPLTASVATQSGQHNNSSSNHAASTTQLPLAPLRPDDLAFVFYVEGEPKGVLLTHGAVKAAMAAHQEYLDTTDIGFDDGLRSGSSNNSGRCEENSNNNSRDGKKAKKQNGDDRLARWYAPARIPALRSRTAPAGRPSYLAYLPLHHIAEFMAQTTFLIRGVLLCYGTRRTLFDAFALPHGDLTEYKPTVFPALPATLARLHRAVQAMLSTGYRKLLFEVAYEARRQAIRRGLQSPFVLSTIFAQPRGLLGGRCRLVLVREAPLHPRDQEYLEVVCGVSVVQQYGPVETAGCGLQQAYCAGHLDMVGGPLGPIQVKLRDVAGGWTHQGERPTGELLLRGPTIMAGYYCQPELTAEVLEKSGWLHSGMVAERCPDGAFRLLTSLRPHHARTSNGQVIDLERLEALYGTHPLCAPGGVCLLVHPYRRYICALVLTTEQRVRAFVEAEANTTLSTSASIGVGEESYSRSSPTAAQSSSRSSPSMPVSPFAALGSAAAEPGWWPQCLRDPALHSAAAKSLVTWITEHTDGKEGNAEVGVAPHERVRHVRVLYDVWDVARHTRTPTRRLFRHGIHCRYSSIIYELFTDPD